MTNTAIARKLRRNATEAEMALWRILRTLNVKFRRQQPVGPYIADFICFNHHLIVECDGGQHADNPADRSRDSWFASQGFSTLRFWNHEVLANRDGVIHVIMDRLSQTAPSPRPSPARGEGE